MLGFDCEEPRAVLYGFDVAYIRAFDVCFEAGAPQAEAAESSFQHEVDWDKHRATAVGRLACAVQKLSGLEVYDGGALQDEGNGGEVQAGEECVPEDGVAEHLGDYLGEARLRRAAPAL